MKPIKTMQDLETSFRLYRNCYENDKRKQSIEAEGIFDFEDFERIVKDPETINLEINGARIPILTPIEKRDNWFNLDFYKNLAGSDSAVLYYSHLPPLLEIEPEVYGQALGPAVQALAAENGVLAFEHSDLETLSTQSSIAALLDSFDVDYDELTARQDVDARHYHYVSPTGLTQASEAKGAVDFYNTYRAGLESGVFRSDDPVSITERLDDQDIEHVWSFYDDVNLELSALDPAHAGFNKQELAEAMQSDRFTKVLNKVGGTIVNLCLIVDIQACSWMNQYYYQKSYSDHYENGRIICGVGLVSNPNIKHQLAPSLQTLGAIGKLICLSQVEHVFTFACNTTSNAHVPMLTEHSLNRAGLSVNFSKPLGHQSFKALQLSPKRQ